MAELRLEFRASSPEFHLLLHAGIRSMLLKIV